MLRATAIIIMSILVHTAQFGQLKVEPPFWWEGLRMDTLQLMVYGKDIGKVDRLNIQPSISNVKLTRVNNLNYLFIDLPQNALVSGTYVLNFYANSDLKYSISYEIKPNSTLPMNYRPINQSDVIYLIMPDRFANGNPDIDNHSEMIEKSDRTIPHGRQGGDLRGIIDRIDYLYELGVTTLWMTPLCEDNDEKYSYHGYAQSDVYRIDPRYGTNEEYKELSRKLASRGMKLIKDYVVNHWGLYHWILKDKPFDDWINHTTGYRQTSHRTTAQIDPYASKYDRDHVADGWFVPSMPDLNIKHPLVLKYIIQNAIWWIAFAELDGLRVDTYAYNDKDAIAQWTKAITDVYPGFFIVGEVWKHDQAQIAYWQKDSYIAARFGYNSHLPALMDFTLHDALSEVFNEDDRKESWHKGLIKVYENMVNDIVYTDPSRLLIFLENHDTQRFNEIYNSDIRKYKLGLVLIATLRGIPQLYYGSEIGMRGVKDYGDADIRRPFPGGWPDDERNAFEGKGRTDEENQFFELTKKVLNWRKQSEAVSSGSFHHYVPEDNLYVYFRISAGQRILIVLNNSMEVKDIDWSRYEEQLANAKSGIEVLTGKIVDFKSKFKIEEKDAMIIEF